MLRALREAERYNHTLLRTFLSALPTPFLVIVKHTGILCPGIPPTLEGILQTRVYDVVFQGLRTSHGAAVPLKAAYVYGRDGSKHLVFLATEALIHRGGKLYARYKRSWARIEPKSDAIEIHPEDRIEPTMVYTTVRGDFYSATIEILDVVGEIPKHVRIRGKSFVVSEGRGPMKLELSRIPTIVDDVAYVGLGFTQYLQIFLSPPYGIGYKRAALVHKIIMRILDAAADNPLYPLIAVAPDGSYVLLKRLPVACFDERKVAFPIEWYSRTVPPFHYTKNAVPVLMPGSIVEELPRVEMVRGHPYGYAPRIR